MEPQNRTELDTLSEVYNAIRIRDKLARFEKLGINWEHIVAIQASQKPQTPQASFPVWGDIK